MSYQILPNIIFIIAVAGIIIIILRRLPEAGQIKDQAEKQAKPETLLSAKGLPARAISKTRTLIKIWAQKIWHFALEAKDLQPTTAVGYRIKKIFQANMPPKIQRTIINVTEPLPAPKQNDEEYFFEQIKKDPKDLFLYDSLGKYYLESQNYSDGKDIYLYLNSHEPTNPDYCGRLAYCFYQMKEFGAAAENYSKSLALDSIQPNRYYNLGICLQHLGKNQEAIEAFTKALGLDPKNTKFLMTLSKAYLKIGDGQKAQILLNTVQQIENKTIQ